MSPSRHVHVRINLETIRNSAASIKSRTGVSLLAVVKADAYGLGAKHIVKALSDIADGYCVFNLDEAIAANVWTGTGKTARALGPNFDAGVGDFVSHHVRPAVWHLDRAKIMQRARPLLSVDTGMQRFACPPEQIDTILATGIFDEAFTHATSIDRVAKLLERVGGRGLTLHAAGSSLLDEPTARLDAVRPGLALYRGAVRVATRLIETRRSDGPIGYSGFSATHHGVIGAGYSHGMRIGPCLVNGRRSNILEVGMQTAFVATTESDKVGDEVLLLGDTLRETDIAAEWKTSPHEVLTRLCAMGVREYVG